MTPYTPYSAPTPTFSPAEQHSLRILRARYQLSRDFFSLRELASLRFVRWLYQTGRLAP